MSALTRDYFNLTIFNHILAELIESFERSVEINFAFKPTRFVLPEQPYNATASDAPLILWSPRCKPTLTVFMPHVRSGDYFVSAHASQTLNSSHVSVRSTTQDVAWPINEFDCFENGKQRRLVRAYRDSLRWEFLELGEPLSFETLENYKRRRIRDRFQREQLVTYLERWGAPVKEPDFWRADAKAFTIETSNS